MSGFVIGRPIVADFFARYRLFVMVKTKIIITFALDE